MRRNLKRYYGAGDLHFITCSCYRRQPLLGTARRRDFFLTVLEQTGGPLKPGVGLSGEVDSGSNRRQNNSVKNLSTYPHNEHRVVWATRR